MAFLELLFPENDKVSKIIRRIGAIGDQHNTKVYLVGGIIRDRILGRESKDIDITVLGDGIEFAHKIAHSFRLKKVIEYPRFGTTLIPYHNLTIEVATARTEEYDSNSRKPKVIKSDLKNDLARRDFTVNTLAMSLNSETQFQLIDYFEGLKDLDAGLIRTPLDPGTTFSDDPLRMLRAIRFASQLGFRIEGKTFKAISEVKERIKIISQERITEELMKMLSVKEKPSVGFYLLKKSGLLNIIFPELYELSGVEEKNGYHHKDIFNHTMQVLDNISTTTDKVELRFTALVHDIAKPITKKYIEGKGWAFHGHEEIGSKMIPDIGKRFKLSNKMIEYAAKLTGLHLRPIALVNDDVTDSAIRRLIIEAGEDLEDLIILCKADITSKNPKRVTEYQRNFDRIMQRINEVQERDKIKIFQSPVRGDEIMKLFGLKPGPAVGFIKKSIEEAILEGEIPNTFEAGLKYLIENKKSLLEKFEKRSS
jgi:tRNA nucleotidyltransferase/poly(A) polymerase